MGGVTFTDSKRENGELGSNSLHFPKILLGNVCRPSLVLLPPAIGYIVGLTELSCLEVVNSLGKRKL